MKTMYIADGSNIVINHETQEATHMESCREAINRIYRITEDMHIFYGSGENKKDLYAKDGDILIVFYESLFPNTIILVNSAEWSENLQAYEDAVQREKEEWAKKHANDNLTACPCCDCCEKCC